MRNNRAQKRFNYYVRQFRKGNKYYRKNKRARRAGTLAGRIYKSKYY